MLVISTPSWLWGKTKVNVNHTVHLEEDGQLIHYIVEYRNKGQANESIKCQHVLHRNVIYLATIADANKINIRKVE